MRAKASNAGNKKYYFLLVSCLLIQVGIYVVKDKPEWIEQFYSRSFYPFFSYVSIVLFSWVPFSIGDVIYLLVVAIICLLIGRLSRALWRRESSALGNLGLRLASFLCFVYTIFYVNWGLNYYRVPVAEHLNLDTQGLHVEDYARVLAKYIVKANELRGQLGEMNREERSGVKREIEELMRQDTIFATYLSKSQIHAKSPISSELISYFTVSGYFNPFTQEAHINQEIPSSSYPFVYAHELAHQMGVGFEDDCNFIAFRVLIGHNDAWYQYTACYAAIQSLLRPLYGDKAQLNKIKGMLSRKVMQDFEQERIFWESKRGWLDRISNVFYNSYLKHNNQPEGLSRYDMMAKLIVAWERQQK